MTQEVTTFLIEAKTGQDYTLDDYTVAAGEMANLLTGVAQTVSEWWNEVRAECEVCMDDTLTERELVGRIAVHITRREGEARAKLEKPRIAGVIKAQPAALLWPKMKICKKAVD
jgi:hypothetical protein